MPAAKNANADAANMVKDATQRAEAFAADTQKVMGEQLEKLSKGLESTSTFNRESVDAVMKSTEITTKAVEGLNAEMVGYSTEGEVMQLAAAKDLTTTEDAHLAIINAKTAALFSAAGEVGAAIAERPAQEQAALRSYGKMLGIAFQLVDDALDYSGDSAKLGKSVGDDFREGKITLPVILAYRRGDAAERAFWARAIADGDIKDGDLEHAMDLMQGHKAIEATLERARHYGTIAKDELAIFQDCEAKAALIDVVDFCIGRVN